LVMATTPLYGFGGPGSQTDQLAFLRVVFASAQGTLMELGIGPIVTSGLILQLLVGSDIIKLNTMIVIVGESAAYILGGALGGPCTATVTTNCLTPSGDWVIFAQLFVGS